MNTLDQLELDVLAATGDIEAAEMARILALTVTEDAIAVGCYMLGIPPEHLTVEIMLGIADD